jgi:hypothetical protein
VDNFKCYQFHLRGVHYMSEETSQIAPELETARQPSNSPDIELQVANFEDRLTQRLDSVEAKIDAIGDALRVAPAIVDWPADLTPTTPLDAPEGKSEGVLGGIVHTVTDLGHQAARLMGSDYLDQDADGNPDGAVPVHATGSAAHPPAVMADAAPADATKAVDVPLGTHTQAIAERRAQPAPAAAMEF